MWKVKITNLKNQKELVTSFRSAEEAFHYLEVVQTYAVVPYKTTVKYEKEVA